jgi:hypothetical protein
VNCVHFHPRDGLLRLKCAVSLQITSVDDDRSRVPCGDWRAEPRFGMTLSLEQRVCEHLHNSIEYSKFIQFSSTAAS